MTRVYLWRENRWFRFPSPENPEYTGVQFNEIDNIDPRGMSIVIAATGQKEARAEGLVVETTRRASSDSTWHWIRGQTYLHRETLRHLGCRWHKKRRAWYYIGETLPDDLRAFVDQVNGEAETALAEDDHDPCSLEEAASVLGLSIASPRPERESETVPPRFYEIGDTVYTRHETELPNGRTVPTRQVGKVVKLYKRNPTYGWSCDVEFAMGTGWLFERELTSLKGTPGIRVTRGSVVPPGAVPPPTDTEIKAALLERNEGPLPVENGQTTQLERDEETPPVADGKTTQLERDEETPPVADGQATRLERDEETPPVADGQATRLERDEKTPPVADGQTTQLERNEAAQIEDEAASDEDQEDESEQPSIRVFKPFIDDGESDTSDPVIAAVRAARSAPPVRNANTAATHNCGTRQRIPQSACGELTGSITGHVWCYGYAVHEEVCIYVNMAGPRTAVEAIRAKLSGGGMVSCVPDDQPSIELTAGEGNTGRYATYLSNMPQARFSSLIMCHELLTTPNYGGDSTTFLFELDELSAKARLHHHVKQLVKMPVFTDWQDYLWQAGQSAMLVRKTRTGGDVRMKTITLDADAWTRLLTGGLSEGIIQLPQS